MKNKVTPYGSNESKKVQVQQMFDSIATNYDFLNHVLSAGIDILWRKHSIKVLKNYNIIKLLDIATGTGDFAIEAAALKPQKIIGLDISEGMLQVGRDKIKRKGLDGLIELVQGDSEALPFPDNYVEGITVGFGVRNFENLEQGLSEILRVLKPGGAVVILEPSFPKTFPMKQIFKLYFTKILPLIGRLVSKDNAAYNYLPNSVESFPSGTDFLDICKKVGFKKVQWIPLSAGICALYLLEK